MAAAFVCPWFGIRACCMPLRLSGKTKIYSAMEKGFTGPK